MLFSPTPELCLNPSEVCVAACAYSLNPCASLPELNTPLRRSVPKLPAPVLTTTPGRSVNDALAKLIEPTNDEAPTVEVPTPRCTWMLSTALAKSPRSAK